jgi:hypothetical protein
MLPNSKRVSEKKYSLMGYTVYIVHISGFGEPFFEEI